LRPGLSRRLGIILRKEKTRDRGLWALVEELERLAEL
jgi:hypothetical protein